MKYQPVLKGLSERERSIEEIIKTIQDEELQIYRQRLKQRLDEICDQIEEQKKLSLMIRDIKDLIKSMCPHKRIKGDKSAYGWECYYCHQKCGYLRGN